ncbi:MAG: sugar ABC transporter permease [Spirochaetaceae bacterium]|jgi:sn-glycerol 3-phosphate transport system permease protein|nr:sugar ABC transporter permease [Spirochaetaceae bacterium]
MNTIRKKNFNPAPYLFLMPCLLVFGIFVFFPFVKTVLYSFTLTNSRGKPVEFVGLENYIKLFTSPAFYNSLKLTLMFAPLVCIPTLLASYVLAALANARVKGGQVYEVMYSLPMAVASAPAAAIWFILLTSGKSGVVNFLLGTEIRWFLDAKYALIGVAFVTVWLNIGAGFIFLLTGFRNVPDELIESARIDGAGYFKRLFSIITPVASPQIFFVVFLNIIVSFQAFAQIRLLTQGGPSYSTNVLVYSIYQAAIRESRFETAFAQSMVLFFIILGITLIQFKTEDRMVFYQ